MNISTILNKAAKLWPEKKAVICGDISLSYSEFTTRSKHLARFFITSGLQPGDRVAIIHQNCHVYLEVYFAAAYAGLILVPINYRFSDYELGFVLQDSGAKVLISNREFEPTIMRTLRNGKDNVALEQIIWTGLPLLEIPELDGLISNEYEETLKTVESEKLPVSTGNDTPAHLYYTSGTTGRPKGVVLTHSNVILHSEGAVEEFQLTGSDAWGHIAPMYHLADAWATFAITMVGGTHVLVPRFEPERVLYNIDKNKITISNLIPTMLNMLVNYPKVNDYDYSSLRCLLSGGAPIAPELVKKIINTFKCDYIQTYGMTETSPYLTVSILEEHLKHLPELERLKYISKTGRPFINVELKVVDESGHEVKKDDKTVGEVWVRGPTISPGYWNNPEETAVAFQDDWLKTGDLAVIDSEGYINIVDRKKDMIITGGENVYSTEVEYVLYAHPGILEAAVIGVPDDKWGEAVKAVVVLKKGYTISGTQIIDFCRGRLANYKIPKTVEFLDELPKTGTGKVAKEVLKDRYWKDHGVKRVH